MPNGRGIYLGLFLVSFCILIGELTLTRIFSVTLGYHFAFLAISIALFGLGTAGILVYVRREWFPPERLGLHLSRAASGYGAALYLVVLVLLHVPVPPGSVPALTFVYLLSAVPFFLGGLVLALAYTHRHAWIGRLYCFDLLGAAAGCLGVAGALNLLGGPATAFVIGGLAQVAALVFGVGHQPSPLEAGRHRRRLAWLAGAGVVAGAAGLAASRALRPAALALGERWFPQVAHDYGLPNPFSWYVDQYLGAELDRLTRFGTLLCISVLLLAAAVFLLVRRESRPGAGAAGAAGRSHLLLPAWLAVQMVVFVALDLGTGAIKVRFAQGVAEPPALYEGWNSISRIKVSPHAGWGSAPVFAWGLSPAYSGPPIDQMRMDIDSTAAMPMIRFSGDLESPQAQHLKYDVSSLGFYLTERPKSLIIGPGGGRDILTSLVFSARKVVGVELNPIILDVINRVFGDYTGRLYRRPDVDLILGEGRSFLRRSTDRFDIIQISLIDTWASVSRGALAISENTLYTQEAFDDYLDHLTDSGVLAFTRWWEEPPQLLYRMLEMTMASQRRVGVDPSTSLFVVRGPLRGGQGQGRVAIMIAGRRPFTEAEVRRIVDLAGQFQFDLVYAPGEPGFPEITSFIRQDESARRRFLAAQPRDLTPVTDNRPFFFYTTRPGDFFRLAEAHLASQSATGMISRLFYVILFLVVAFMYGPLALLKGRELRAAGSGGRAWLLYFAALGLGYIMVEMVLIQRFILFLGHPLHAITVVIFSLLASSGLGSFLAGRIDEGRVSRRQAQVLLGVALLLGLTLLVFPSIMSALFRATLPVRILAAVAMVAPPGLLMGMPFALGVRRLGRESPGVVPWMWGVNGAASVLGTVAAACFSMNLGFGITYGVGIACYLGALVVLIPLRRPAPELKTARAAA